MAGEHLRGTTPPRSKGLKRRRMKEPPEAVLEDPAARWLWHFAKGERTTFSVATVASYSGLPAEQFAPTVAWFLADGYMAEIQPGIYTGKV